MKSKIKTGKGGNLGQTIYDDTAAFGLFMSMVYLIIGLFVGGLMVIGGIYFLFKKNVFTEITNATVTNSVCNNNTTRNSNGTSTNTLQCKSTVNYTVDSEKLTSSLSTGTTLYNKDDSLNIYYNPSKPTEIATSPTNWKILGFFLLIFGLLTIGGVILQYYIVHRYKFAAAATGVDAGIQGARNVL